MARQVHAARAKVAKVKYFLQVFRRSTIVFSANAWLYLRVFWVSADPVGRQVHAARAKVVKVKFSPRCARQIPEKTGDLV